MHRSAGLGCALPLAIGLLSGCTDSRAAAPASGAVPGPSAAAPSLVSVSPVSGPVAGGTSLTLTGAGFRPGATVTVGGAAATSVAVLGATAVTAVTPAAAAGPAHVVVTNPDAQASSLLNGFTYLSGTAPAPTLAAVAPATGPTAGGQTCTLSGSGFQPGATVAFGGNPATGVVVLSAGSLTCVTPVGAAGAVSVGLMNPDAQSASIAGAYTYSASPTVSAVSPASGDVSGGTPVTITGTNFATGATVAFGSAAATSVVVASSGSLTCVTPPGPAGATGVTVTNPGALQATLAGGFLYVTGGTIPSVTSVAPAAGPSAGGTAITIAGSGFASGAGVAIGGAACSAVTRVNATTLTAVTPRAPAGVGGALPVTVTNPGGASGSLGGAYTFVPTSVESIADLGYEPDVVVDGSGTVHVVWKRLVWATGATAILHVRSTDGGRTWSSPPTNVSGGTSRVGAPRIAARGSTLVAVWNDETGPLSTPTCAVYAATSSDGGATWASASSLAGAGPYAPTPSVAADGSGTFHVAFQHTSATYAITVRVLSGTPAAGFGSPVTVIGPVGRYSRPAVAADGATVLVAATGPAAPGTSSTYGDAWVSRSTDGGATWGTAAAATATTGVEEAGVGVAVRGSAAVLTSVSWYYYGSQFSADTPMAQGSIDGGQTWGSPAALGTTTFGPGGGGTYPPHVAADPSGAFALVWSRGQVYACRTTDAGRTFSPSVSLTAPTGGAAGARVACGSAGLVIHVWNALTTQPTQSWDIWSY